MKNYRETFNDGVMIFGRTKTDRSETGKRIGEKFEALGKLAFHIMSHREEDYKLADALGSSLDLKVKTMFPATFKKYSLRELNKFKAKIQGVEYDVIRVDKNPSGDRLFFYLQEVGRPRE